jgi:hypothetical protein
VTWAALWTAARTPIPAGIALAVSLAASALVWQGAGWRWSARLADEQRAHAETREGYQTRLATGEAAARSALQDAQAKAQEAADEYATGIARITTAVDGLPRRVRHDCAPVPAAGGGGAAPAGGAAAAPGGLLRPADGGAPRPDFDARPWRELARECEAVAVSLRACLR